MALRGQREIISRSLQRHGYQRLFGIPATTAPRDPGCWSYANGRVEIDLSRAPELNRLEGALRLHGGELPVPLLVIRGDDRRFHAFCNRCRHRGRCLDPLGGTRLVQCCSLGRATYDYRGHAVSGPTSNSLETFPVRAQGGRVVIRVLSRPEWSVRRVIEARAWRP